MAKDRIKEDADVERAFRKREDLQITISLRLSVPQMWNARAKAMMYEAVDYAGIIKRDLVNEPQCALAASMDIVDSTNVNPLFDLGSDAYVMVYDLGCGTSDAVVYKLKGDLNRDNLRVSLEPVDQAPGTTWSSHEVNERLLQFVDAGLEEKEKDETCEKLQMSRYDLRWQLLQRIEEQKCGPSRSWYTLVIPCAKTGESWNATDHGVEVSSDVMREKFKEVVTGMTDMGDTLLAKDGVIPAGQTLTAVLLLGGFSNCKYVQDCFKEKYKSTSTVVIVPGSMGVVTQSNQNFLGNILMPFSFLQDEDIRDHESECHEIVDHEMLDGSIEERPGLLIPNTVTKRNGMMVAPDRLIKLLSSADDSSQGPVARSTPTWYHVYTDGLSIRKYFVRVDEGTIFDDHDALRQNPNDPAVNVEYWPFKPGFHSWKVVRANLSVEDLNAHFTLKGTRESKYYRVSTRAIVRYTDNHAMTIKWEISKSVDGETLFEVDGEQKVWGYRRSDTTRDEAELPGGTAIA